MCQGGELNTATITPGIQYVMMIWLQMEMKPEFSVLLWDTVVHIPVYKGIMKTYKIYNVIFYHSSD